MDTIKNIGVIGGGISGIVTAHLLSRKHRVTLFERNRYLGGHTNTVVLDAGPDTGAAIDTGFIVLNDHTYPNFHAFLEELEVPWRFTDMSFSVWCEKTNLQYCSRDLSSIFAQRSNLVSPTFWRLLLDIKLFWRLGLEALGDPTLGERTLGDFLAGTALSKTFKQDFLYPLGAAIWSTPSQEIEAFPAKTFLTFFKNHGYLRFNNLPHWQTVKGGSYQYVEKFLKLFKGTIKLNADIARIYRDDHGKQVVVSADGARQSFDEIVLACHADESRKLLSDATAEEQAALKPWQYNVNRTLLHTDATFMPPNKRAWASWNYVKHQTEHGTEPVSVTYDMNRLQGLETKQQYFVTLNPRREPEGIIREFYYTHPVYLPQSVRAQENLKAINGKNGRWFAGAYMGFGFHEDGVNSALAVTKEFGESL